jgi:hypothetical protein
MAETVKLVSGSTEWQAAWTNNPSRIARQLTPAGSQVTVLFTEWRVKQCAKCRVTKAETNFSAHPSTADRLDSICKPCRAHYFKWYAAQRKALAVETAEAEREGIESEAVTPAEVMAVMRCIVSGFATFEAIAEGCRAQGFDLNDNKQGLALCELMFQRRITTRVTEGGVRVYEKNRAKSGAGRGVSLTDGAAST